jgi:transposase
MVLSVRELLVKQRTQLVNAVRGHAAEFGVIAAKGAGQAGKLLERLSAEPAIPPEAASMFACLGDQIVACEARIAGLDQKLERLHQTNPVSQLLAEIPGIGRIGAVTLALSVDPAQFRSARHFAAWLGLTPREHSTAGRQRLGAISREGNERLRQLLVLGATAVVKVAKPGKRLATPWLLKLLGQGKPRKLVAVALANKMARIVWAMMASGEAYRSGHVPAPAA